MRLLAAAGLIVGATLARQPLAHASATATYAAGDTIPVVGVGLARDGSIAGNAGTRAVLLRGHAVQPVPGAGDDDPSYVVAMSRAGNVAGTLGDGADTRGFVWMQDGAVHTLPPGYRPVAVNDAGVVVGTLAAGEGRSRSATWRAGEGLAVIPDSEEQPFVAVDVNDRGEVLASAPGAGVWSGGVVRPLPAEVQAGTTIRWSASVAINDRGEILANGMADGGPQPFVWSAGAARALPRPEGDGQTHEVTATAMNDRGQAVGSYVVYGEESDVPERFAVLWGRDGVRTLRGMPGTRSCVPSAINDAGTVLGRCEFRGPWKMGEGAYPSDVPVIWENGVARPLCGGERSPGGPGNLCDPATYVAGQPAQVLTASIHPRLPPYAMEFEVRDGIPVSVTVRREDGTGEPQRIQIPDGSTSSRPVQLVDLDFDGYQDLSVLTMGGVHNESFDYYLFDPAASAFAYFRGDNMLVPDSARQVLEQRIHGSCCAGELRTFRWEGAELVLVRNEVWEPVSGDPAKTLYVVSERRNGQMVEVSRRVGGPEQ